MFAVPPDALSVVRGLVVLHACLLAVVPVTLVRCAFLCFFSRAHAAAGLTRRRVRPFHTG